MQWYWWVIIIAAVAAFIPLKMKLTKVFLKNQKDKQKAKEEMLEEDK
jgi:hypothetical protein